MLPILLQLYSVRDELENDYFGTLQKVKAMGYDGVELSGLNGSDPVEVKKMLNDAGLVCPSSHAPVAELFEEGAFERYAQVGCSYVAIPWMSYGDKLEKLAENLDIILSLAKKARAAGITLLYHNHDFEFKRAGGKAVLDIIYDTVPESLLKTQLDTCWVKFAGEDPVEYVRKYSGRAPLVHLKDFFSNGDNGKAPYDLIGTANTAMKETNFEFRPIGHGVQDIASIVKAAELAAADWLVVEQDESKDRKTLESAKMSIDYLRSM